MVKAKLTTQLLRAVERAREIDEVRRTPAADHLWAALYDLMADDDPPGLVGAVTSRAEAQTLRLSLLYALLDGSNVIEVDHLQAAWEVWQHCRASCAAIFDNLSGDPVADKLLKAVRESAGEGLTRTAVYERVFAKSKDRSQINDAVALLIRLGQIDVVIVQTAGRPVERLFPVAQRSAGGAVLSVISDVKSGGEDLTGDNTVNTAHLCTLCDEAEGVHNWHDERVCGACLASLDGPVAS